jgi:predicted dehydrogenase
MVGQNKSKIMSKKELRVGLIGCGFMGRTHSNGYKRVSNFFPDLEYTPVLKAVCARSEDKVKAFAEQWGYESYETDWRKLIARDDIDAVESNKVKNTIWYNYRRLPAVTLAKQIVDSGALGKIFHYRTNFLQDWTINENLPQGGAAFWRMDADAAGSGVTGDLLAHCIDLAMWLNGGIKDVSSVTEIFVKQRVHDETGKMEDVKIDDACLFHCHFDNGSLGLFESTRYARGHKALFTFEINGEKGSLKWDLHDLNRLEYFNNADDSTVRGWRSIHVTDGDQPYMDKWWVPGLSVGYEHSFVHQVADFLQTLETGEECHPTFRDALETQKVCEAVINSANNRRWEDTHVDWKNI